MESRYLGCFAVADSLEAEVGDVVGSRVEIVAGDKVEGVVGCVVGRMVGGRHAGTSGDVAWNPAVTVVVVRAALAASMDSWTWH